MKSINTIKSWNNIKKEFENSGLTVKEYCDSKQLSISTFYRNMNHLKELGLYDDIDLPDLITIYINGNKIELDPTLDNYTLGRIIKLCIK